MGHVTDRWTTPGAGGRRVKGPRFGHGKRWLARWVDPDGGERSKACASKDEALAHLAKIDVDVRAGTYVRDTRITFQTYAGQWLTHQVHHRPSTATQAESRLRLHAFPAFGQVPIGRIRRSDIQAMIGALTMAPGSVKVVYAYTSAVFRSALEDHLIATTPCTRIALPELTSKKVVPLTVTQVRGIAEAMLDSLTAMVWVAAGTGMRPGELRGLTTDRVMLGKRRGVIRVDRQLATVGRGGVPVWGPGKTPSADRSVAIGASTVAALRAHLEAFPPGESGLVFTTTRGTPLSRSSLQWAWADATVGIVTRERSGWHDLRHHHASLLIAAGRSPRAVADRLGHADPAETLRVYSHLWDTDEDLAVAAFEAAYSAVGASADGPGTDQG